MTTYIYFEELIFSTRYYDWEKELSDLYFLDELDENTMSDEKQQYLLENTNVYEGD